jgi:hypothetical protein
LTLGMLIVPASMRSVAVNSHGRHLVAPDTCRRRGAQGTSATSVDGPRDTVESHSSAQHGHHYGGRRHHFSTGTLVTIGRRR